MVCAIGNGGGQARRSSLVGVCRRSPTVVRCFGPALASDPFGRPSRVPVPGSSAAFSSAALFRVACVSAVPCGPRTVSARHALAGFPCGVPDANRVRTRTDAGGSRRARRVFKPRRVSREPAGREPLSVARPVKDVLAAGVFAWRAGKSRVRVATRTPIFRPAAVSGTGRSNDPPSHLSSTCAGDPRFRFPVPAVSNGTLNPCCPLPAVHASHPKVLHPKVYARRRVA